MGCTIGGKGAGTYPYPAGWLKFNVDGRTPAAQVAYINEAWEVREDFAMDAANCAAFSTSFYEFAGAADDWTWTPAITLPPGGSALSWRARAYDPSYRDGYEVRIKTGDAPTLANQGTSTVVFAIGQEFSDSWQYRLAPLSDYAGQTVYVGFRNNSFDKFLLVIDDVKVMGDTPSLVAIAPSHSSDYPRVPSGQTVHSILGVGARNESAIALTNVNATATILRDGVSVGPPLMSTPIATLAAGATATVEFPIGYTFNGDGSWTIKYELSSNESASEVSLLDNVIFSNPTVIGGVELARYEGQPIGVIGISDQTEGEIGSLFEIMQAATFEGVRFGLGAEDYPGWEGQTIVANLRAWDAINNTPGDIIATTVGITSSLDGGTYDVAFTSGPQSLSQGKYVVTVVEPAAGPAMPLLAYEHRFKAATQWVSSPTIRGGAWLPVKSYGATFARSHSISLITEFPLFADGFDGVAAAHLRAPAMAPSPPSRKKPATQLVQEQ